MSDKSIAWISLGVSVVSLIISVLVLVNYCPTQGLNFDYIGVIVGILALLVTVLIGLQWYNYIYAREDIKRIIDEQVRNMISDYEQVTKARDNIIDGYEYVVSDFVNEKIVDHIIKAIQELEKCENVDMKTHCLDFVMDEAHLLCTKYTEARGRKIYKNKRLDYLYVMKDVDHKYSPELINYIENAEEVDSHR